MLFVAFSITLLGGFADVFCFSGNPTFSAESKITAISPFLIKDVTVDGGASMVEKNISADGTKVTFKVSFSAPGKATSTVTFKAPNPWPAGIPPEVPPDERTHEFTVVDVELAADKNRNKKIDDTDLTITEPFYFWLNDDNDKDEDWEDSDDIPSNAFANSIDNKVNGMRDLVDFFPISIKFDPKDILNQAGITLHLRTEQGELKIVPTTFGKSDAGDYLVNESKANLVKSSTTIKVDALQDWDVPTSIVNRLKSDGEAVILAEARLAMNGELQLIVKKDSNELFRKGIKLKIDGVENMFRHMNLRSVAGGKGGASNRLGEPSNFPDQSSKNFVFIHGYNVNGYKARGWHSEVFKRMFWSGSKAKFIGITWNGNEGTIPVIGFTPDYHINVKNAFISAEALKNFIADNLTGEVVVGAHSLGNMLASAAIEDYSANISKYFLINAAVAIEAYHGAATKQAKMIHSYWAKPELSLQVDDDYDSATLGYYDEFLWASEWHKRFEGTGDAREKLTWRNRFGNVASRATVYNFFSGGADGEEVLTNWKFDYTDVPDLLDAREGYAWALQELMKGRMGHATGALGGSDSMGWGFNYIGDESDPSGWYKTINIVTHIKHIPWLPNDTVDPQYSANDIVPSELIQKPFFRMWFNDDQDEENLFVSGALGNAYADSRKHYILARGIPSRTFAVGANSVTIWSQNFNMPVDFKSNSWSRVEPQWLHSDFRDMPYMNVYKVYDKFVSSGGLGQ